MGIFLNPGNDRFRQALNSQIYVDKSELISVTNKRICSEQKYICVSRPRRFGKSVNLGMLAAYYSKGCDSRELFDGLAVSKDESYLNHLNKYNVIYLNMQQFLSESHDIEKMLDLLSKSIMYDLEDDYEDFKFRYEMGLVYNLERLYQHNKIPFVFLIDEWDCVMRENMDNKDAQKIYLDFIRNLLKDRTYVALAYMTGILPIKKYGSHSALNMFREYSMLKSAAFSKFSGFTNIEVQELCKQQNMDFDFSFRNLDANVGWEADTDDEEENKAIDKAMRNRGFMKAMDSYGSTSEPFRTYNNDVRRILVKQYLRADQEYWLRFRQILEGSTLYMSIDYIEICPKDVYDSPDGEDRH